MTPSSSSSHAAVPLLTPDRALFLDFDGTLTDIQDDPDTVVLPQGGAEALVALSARIGGALAVISPATPPKASGA